MKSSRLIPAMFVLLAGCASNVHYQEGRELIAAGQNEAGLARLEQSVREFPDDREARAYYFSQRSRTVAEWSAAAEEAKRTGKFADADANWRRVLTIDPENPRAKAGLVELDVARRREVLLLEAQQLTAKGDIQGAEIRLRTILAEDPSHAGARSQLMRLQEMVAKADAKEPALKSAMNKPITLDFRDTALKTVLEVLSRTAGLNFVMDRDVRSDTKVTIFVRNASIDEVLRMIMVTNQLQYRVIGETSILVYPALAPKIKEYQDTVTRNFYLQNMEARQAVSLFKSITKSKDMYVDDKLNLVVLRDTPEAIRLAERLVETVDLPEPEVMLEIEVLELSRSRLKELGVNFPDQVGYGRITPDIVNQVLDTSGNTLSKTTTLGGALATGMVDLKERSNLTTYVSNPGLLMNLKDQIGDSSLLANPRIRVKNREKAKIHIGEKLPVFTTTSTANVGVSASVTYLDVGLKLDVEPTVHLDYDVDIKVGLEVSSIVKEVTGPSNSLAYQIGTRSASTVLRLKDGETQVLAGLINDEERSSANRLPGLGDLPLLGRLFSSQRDSAGKTEIVLLVTPRVVRNLPRPQLAAPTLPAGTDAEVGAPPLILRPSHSMSLSSQPPIGASAVPAVPMQQEAPPAEEGEHQETPPGQPVPDPAAGTTVQQ